MSARQMLDTNAVSALVKGRANALGETMNDRQVCVSVITEAELGFGLARRGVNADLRRIVENFLHAVVIVPWTSACARRYGPLRAELEALGKPLAPMDLLIATHALAEDCTLVSADRAFARVPGLRVFDWSAGEATTLPDRQVQHRRGKLAQQTLAPYDISSAAARARTSAPRPSASKKGRRPKAK